VLYLYVFDLRRYGRNELRFLEAEVIEHEGGLTIDHASSAGLVNRLIYLVFEVGVGNSRTNAISVRMEMADNIDLAYCLRHGVPRYPCLRTAPLFLYDLCLNGTAFTDHLASHLP